MNCTQRDGGQIAIDFLTGITIFIFAMFFLFNFVTTSLLAYSNPAGVNTASVDRAAERLHSDLLTSEDLPRGVLNETVAKNYFNSSNQSEIKRDLGIKQGRFINVTVSHLDGGHVFVDSVELTAGARTNTSGGFESTSILRVAHMQGEGTVHLELEVR